MINHCFAKALATLVIASLLGASASAFTLPVRSSVIAYDRVTGLVLARGEVRARVLELVVREVSAERPVEVHVRQEGGPALVLFGFLGPEGSINLVVDGVSDQPLTLVLETAGVSLNLVVTKGEGADLAVTPKNPVTSTPPVSLPPSAGPPGK